LDILLSPPLAFFIYIPLVGLIALFGKLLAGEPKPSELKHSIYGSGEKAHTHVAAPGYKPFFLIAFFFAILHLGMLVLGSGSLETISPVYLVGLILALAALILG
jgi:NADH:ubiquinone oxidoreductase subunit 3 (subunit A)